MSHTALYAVPGYADGDMEKLMRENLVRSKLTRGEPVYGVIASNSDPNIPELIGLAGFDFYMMDGEHGSLNAAQAENLVRACEAVGVTPLARVRANDEKLILQFLDAGVMGIMMPGLITPEDVRAFVSYVKYPPLGNRGLGPVRAADYMAGKMSQAQYVSYANEQTLVFPQFEDIRALEYLGKIVQAQGVDGVIVGPRDLAMSMGFYDGPAHPEVQAVIDQVFETILAAGLVVGTVAGTAEAARKIVERGGTLCLNSVQGLITSSANAFLKAVHA